MRRIPRGCYRIAIPGGDSFGRGTALELRAGVSERNKERQQRRDRRPERGREVRDKVLSQNLSKDFNESFIPLSAYRDDHVAPANRRRRNSTNTRTPSPTITSPYWSDEVNSTTPNPTPRNAGSHRVRSTWAQRPIRYS